MKIEISDLRLEYYDRPALYIDKLQFEGNLGIIGYSDGGKSNLIKAICGTEFIKNGQIFFDGNEICSKKIEERDIALISDITPLFNKKSVFFNVVYGLKMHGGRRFISRNKQELKGKVGQVLAGIDQDARVGDLSEAQRMRVLVARVLLRNPKLVIVDEPYKISSDANTLVRIIGEELSGHQILIASYDFDLIKGLCDYFIIMRNGGIIFEGTREQVISCEDKLVRAMLLL